MTDEEKAIVERRTPTVNAILHKPNEAQTVVVDPNHAQPLEFADIHTFNAACEVCKKQITRRGKNRLSDCGHMRRSKGTWVPRESKPEPKQPDAPAGALSETQVAKLYDLIADVNIKKATEQAFEEHLTDAQLARAQAEHDLETFINSLKRGA